MSFVQAIDLSRTFDLSDPFIVRAISRSPKRILTAVDRVSFSIEKGTTYALVGESGSGKSTIAKMAVGLLRPTNGSLLVDGMNLNDPKLAKEETLALRRRIQMVFQSPYASLNPRWRVKDILSEPIKAFNLIENPKAQIDRVHELLEQVGLASSDANKFPHEFSGGQRQRISIARALSSEPEIIVCDEPTSALDPEMISEVLDVMIELAKEGITMICVTHEMGFAKKVANRIIFMDDGQIVEENDPENFFNNAESKRLQLFLDQILTH